MADELCKIADIPLFISKKIHAFINYSVLQKKEEEDKNLKSILKELPLTLKYKVYTL